MNRTVWKLRIRRYSVAANLGSGDHIVYSLKIPGVCLNDASKGKSKLARNISMHEDSPG